MYALPKCFLGNLPHLNISHHLKRTLLPRPWRKITGGFDTTSLIFWIMFEQVVLIQQVWFFESCLMEFVCLVTRWQLFFLVDIQTCGSGTFNCFLKFTKEIGQPSHLWLRNIQLFSNKKITIIDKTSPWPQQQTAGTDRTTSNSGVHAGEDRIRLMQRTRHAWSAKFYGYAECAEPAEIFLASLLSLFRLLEK